MSKARAVDHAEHVVVHEARDERAQERAVIAADLGLARPVVCERDREGAPQRARHVGGHHRATRERADLEAAHVERVAERVLRDPILAAADAAADEATDRQHATRRPAVALDRHVAEHPLQLGKAGGERRIHDDRARRAQRARAIARHSLGMAGRAGRA